MDRRILCQASEKGKIVVNECLDRGYDISTLKLEKLLILMHGIMLSAYDTPLFKENVVATKFGIMIPKVDREFIQYSAYGFKEKLCTYITLLNREEDIVDEVLSIYGDWSVFQLNEIEELRILNQLCYQENVTDDPNRVVPTSLIKHIFDHVELYSDISIVPKKFFLTKK